MDICRFCLMPEEVITDPFISPCRCSGSEAHVHKYCLYRWRRETLNNRHRDYCQICLSQYNIIRRWPIEIIPPFANSQSNAWFILSRPLIFIILLYYTHCIICTKYFPLVAELWDENATRDYELLTNSVGLRCFSTLLGAITMMYVSFYWSFFRAVQQKFRYSLYFLRGDVRYYSYLSPPAYMILLVILYGCASQFIIPFGGLYVLMLPHFMNIHISMIRAMNEEGEV